MLDALTLDQLRMFVSVADEGSFSAAARKLQRVQSAISHAMVTLEAQLGVALWDRTTRIPSLTPHGRTLLAEARRVCSSADELRRRANELAGGLEAEVSLCVDAMYSVGELVALCREFSQQFPSVELRVYTESMKAVAERLLDDSCQLGIAGPIARTGQLESTFLANVRLVPVAAPGHALAQHKAPLTENELCGAVQIVLSERSAAPSPDQGVLSQRTWRVGDLHTKRELILAGLGWGNLPDHMVRDHLEKGTLRKLHVRAMDERGMDLPLYILHRAGLVRGPAMTWLLARIAARCATTHALSLAPPPAPVVARPKRRVASAR